MAKFLLKDLKTEKVKQFQTIEEAREYVKKIYTFEDRSSTEYFYQNFYIAQLFQADTRENVELYMGRGTQDFKNKIIVKVKDQFDMYTGNYNWRTLKTISL